MRKNAQCAICYDNVEERGDINVLVMECGHWVCTNINCRPKRQSKWNQRKGRDEEVDLVCSLCRHVLEPGHEKMRLARIRFLRYPFCVGRPSEPPNYLDGRDKRDPDAGGGGGNPYARAPAPMNSVTPMHSSPSSSTRPSAPSAPSGSSRSAVYNTERLAEVRLDNQVSGKCSECRLVFDVLDSCLVCGQMLCNKCLLQGFHASCIAYPAVSISLSTYKCGRLDANLRSAPTIAIGESFQPSNDPPLVAGCAIIGVVDPMYGGTMPCPHCDQNLCPVCFPPTQHELCHSSLSSPLELILLNAIATSSQYPFHFDICGEKYW